MKVLVTGGAGYIGGFLVDRLLSDGHAVSVLDRFSKGVERYLQEKKNNRKLKLVQADIANSGENTHSLYNNIDWVFHLGGKNHQADLDKNPYIYHRINVTGTVITMDNSRKAGVSKFIYAASASCYGNTDIIPTPENTPVRLENPHALTKYLGEYYVLQLGKIYKLPVISLRIFSVYGPGNKDNFKFGPLLSSLLKRKLAGVPYLVEGSGNQSRDLIYVTDVVEAFILAAKSDYKNEIFNVGMGKSYSIKQIIDLLGGRTAYVPPSPGTIVTTRADISKIRKRLGWKPKVNLENGIKKVLDSIGY